MDQLFEDFIDDIDVHDTTTSADDVAAESSGDITDFDVLMRISIGGILPSLTPDKIFRHIERVLNRYGDPVEHSVICLKMNAAFDECIWSDGRDEMFEIP